jgi:ribonuclease BN (tRNA processing enzyme)
MKIRVLGSAGSEMPDHNLPAFLIDGTILMDAGTIGLSLNNSEQWKIKYILLSHAHLDHIKGIPFLLDNIIVTKKKHSVTVMGGREVLRDLRQNVLNDRIWPDFTKIPDSRNPVLMYRDLSPSRPVMINGYTVHCEKVTHAVPAYGYIIEDRNKKAAAYTGDTGPTDLFWKKVGRYNVCCLITEVSFPNSMNKLALISGHLTADLLKKEIRKMASVPPKIYITHVKPQYRKEIKKEIKALRVKNIAILEDEKIIVV